MNIQVEVPDIFARLYDFQYRNVLLRGGRVSGKSETACQLATLLTLSNPKSTVIITRNSASDLRASSFEQILSIIESWGLGHLYTSSIVPLEITNKSNGSNIQFLGIGGADMHRTKSVKPKNKVLAVIHEELQQVKDQENLEQANASFRRYIDVEKGMFIHIFNPEPQNNHWLNKFYNAKMKDKDWLCIHSTYEDIADFINTLDLKEILKTKRYDPLRWRWLYMGESVGNFGGCYPQFKRDKHLMPLAKAITYFGKEKIVAVIIGGDGAVNNDCTVLEPMFIFTNGQAAIGKIFYYNPKENGVRSSAELIPYIQIWFNELINENGLGQVGGNDLVPIVFRIDNAAAELVRQINYHFSNRALVQKFSKSTVIEMVDVVQATLAKNMVIIIDYGGYYDYVRGQFVKGDNPLAYQLEMVQWNTQQTGYDPAEPNDCTDAFTYAVVTYFKNPTNLYWLETIMKRRQTFYELGGG